MIFSIAVRVGGNEGKSRRHDDSVHHWSIYFCLGEEADDEGKPLVRDCSCRGDSSGFAHFSCLTKYAEQKSRSTSDGEVCPFDEPWEICNYCKQPFQNQLAVDLASAFVTFAEANYGHPDSSKWDKLRILESLRLKSVVLPNMLCETDNSDNEMILLELKNIVNLSLSIIDQTKKDLMMSRWIHCLKPVTSTNIINCCVGGMKRLHIII